MWKWKEISPGFLISFSGHGDPNAGTLSMAAVADDMAALLDALEIPRIHVLGWSFGSAAAQLFALRHPERLPEDGAA